MKAQMDLRFLHKKYKVNIDLPWVVVKNLYKNAEIEVLFYFSCPIKWDYEGLYGQVDYKTTYEFIIFKFGNLDKLFCNHLIFNPSHYDFWGKYQADCNIFSSLKSGKITDMKVITHGGCDNLPLEFSENEKKKALKFAEISNSKKHLDYFNNYCI